MCGLAGYVGVKDPDKRLALVYALGKGIDNRGGDSCGFVSIGHAPGPRFCRKMGEWEEARERFIRQAAAGEICMMHSRWATHGAKVLKNAHPFAIRRTVNGKERTVLWGAHNGVVQSFQSAREHQRWARVDVDSQELFELIADKEFENLRKITGYGVITWIDADAPDHVNMTRLSSTSDMFLASLKEGGMAWASTWDILGAALKTAGLTADMHYPLKDIGVVTHIKPTGAFDSGLSGVHLYKWESKTNYYSPPTTKSGPPSSKPASSKKNSICFRDKQSEDEAEQLWNNWLRQGDFDSKPPVNDDGTKTSIVTDASGNITAVSNPGVRLK